MTDRAAALRGVAETKRLIERIAQADGAKILRVGKETFPEFGDRSCFDIHAFPIGWADGNEAYTVSLLLGGEGGNYNKSDRYRRLSVEKLRRLNRNVEELDLPHLTSFESMDEKLERYQGAVIVLLGGTEWGLSASGLLPPCDESAVLILAELCDPGSRDLANRCAEIVERTKNEYYQRYRDAFFDFSKN